MAGDPASYEPVHLATHGWILTGDGSESSWSGTVNPFEAGTYTGVAGLIDELKELPTTPYALVQMDDPTTPTQPLRELTDHVLKNLQVADERDLPDEFSEALTEIQTDIDGVFDETTISGMVTAFEDRAETRLDSEIGRINNMFSAQGAVNTSTRGLMVMQLEREHARGVDDFEAKLRLELEMNRFNKAVEVAWDATKSEHVFRTQNVQYVAVATQAIALYHEAKRQFANDELRLTMEDLLWDVKMYEFANQALGAIGGAAVVPAKPHPGLEVASSVAGIAGALSPLLIEIFD